MTGDSGPLAAVLAVVSVMSLSLLSLLCLRCRKKSTIMQVESQIYDQQIFQRGGSKFAVMRSKTVTRSYQTPSGAAKTFEGSAFQEGQTEIQGDYENITAGSSPEHDYVAPIAVSLYENEKNRTPEADQIPGIYGNVFPSMSITEDDDYENAAFLEQQMEDEPDYVNEAGDCT
ncbi:LAT2 domain-containing protein [Kryptolebias marmoratus]|uniref:LAT2 domain-containing protein n=1 Tax=Kryptolebias marmoratus TaxID=37003 RepID=UPI0018ACECF3|nr:LAT2 domain-containing protein [Kryptolebias marmoratus]